MVSETGHSAAGHRLSPADEDDAVRFALGVPWLLSVLVYGQPRQRALYQVEHRSPSVLTSVTGRCWIQNHITQRAWCNVSVLQYFKTERNKLGSARAAMFMLVRASAEASESMTLAEKPQKVRGRVFFASYSLPTMVATIRLACMMVEFGICDSRKHGLVSVRRLYESSRPGDEYASQHVGMQTSKTEMLLKNRCPMMGALTTQLQS